MGVDPHGVCSSTHAARVPACTCCWGAQHGQPAAAGCSRELRGERRGVSGAGHGWARSQGSDAPQPIGRLVASTSAAKGRNCLPSFSGEASRLQGPVHSQLLSLPAER